MDEVVARVKEGAREGLVVIADEQTAGRGRMGREWIAPPGSSVLCSVLLRPDMTPDLLSTLPLVVAVAVADAIESVTGVYCQVKWPNDLLVDGAKVAGILIQTTLRPNGVDYAIVGIGINVSTPAESLVPGAISLEIALGKAVSRDMIFASLLFELERGYASYTAASGRPSLDSWRERAAFPGESVSVLVNGKVISGTFVEVDDAGRLVLEVASGGRIALTGGEIQRGPRRSDAEL